MGRLEKIRTEIKKIIKKPYVVLIILAIVTLLIIFAKVRDNQAGEESSALEAGKQTRTEVKDSTPAPEGVVKDSGQTPEGVVKTAVTYESGEVS